MNLALSLMLGTALSSSGGGSSPTLVSLSGRARVANSVQSTGTTQTHGRTRHTVVQPTTTFQPYFWNGFVDASITTASQEVGTGAPIKALSGAIQISPTGPAYNQPSATLVKALFTQAAANAVREDGEPYIAKLDGTQPSGAEFTAAGISCSVDGDILYNLPDGWDVLCDPVPATIPTGRHFVNWLEVRATAKTISAASWSSGTVTITVDNTTDLQTGQKLNISGVSPSGYNATGVTVTISGSTISYPVTSNPGAYISGGSVYQRRPQIISCIGRKAVTGASWSGGIATLTFASSSQGALIVDDLIVVTGMTPSGFNVSNVPVTSFTDTSVSYEIASDPGAFSVGGSIIPWGDITKSGGGGDNYVWSTNWSAIDVTLTANSTSAPCPTMILGQAATAGKRIVSIEGDSIAQNVQDANQLNPSGSYILGDDDGVNGYLARAANAEGYTTIKMAIASTKPETVITYPTGQAIRNRMARLAKVAVRFCNHGTNSTASTIADFKTAIRGWCDNARAATPDARIVWLGPVPKVASTTDNYATKANITQLTLSPFTYPTGFHYAAGGTRDWISGGMVPASGDPDYAIDMFTIAGDVDGNGVDGKPPVNGTAFGYWSDTTHPSRGGHAGLAAEIGPLLPTAFGFSA